MKAKQKLTNVEKAKLLHESCSQQIPAAIKFIQKMCVVIKEDEAEQRERWNNGFFTFDFWLMLINEAEAKIRKYGKKLHISARLFADQLFDGYLAFYTIHCLLTFSKDEKLCNLEFAQVVDLLFDPYS